MRMLLMMMPMLLSTATNVQEAMEVVVAAVEVG